MKKVILLISLLSPLTSIHASHLGPNIKPEVSAEDVASPFIKTGPGSSPNRDDRIIDYNHYNQCLMDSTPDTIISTDELELIKFRCLNQSTLGFY